MLISVVEQFHDYAPQQYVLDSEKLNSGKFVDRMILNELQKEKFDISVNIYAHGWETNPILKDLDERYWQLAKVPAIKADKFLLLTINFDC